MDEQELLRDENKKLRDEIASYKLNGAVGLYYELNRWINNTVNIMRNQSLSSLLTSDKDDPKKFDRIMALIKNAKEHVLDMEDIKDKLGLSGNEERDNKVKPFIETIAERRI